MFSPFVVSHFSEVRVPSEWDLCTFKDTDDVTGASRSSLFYFLAGTRMHLLFSCHYRSPQIFAYFSRLDLPLTFSYTISQSTAYPGFVAQSPRALIKSQPWDLPVGTVYSHSLALSVHLRACGQGSVAYNGSSFQAQCVPCAGTGLSTIILSFPPFPSSSPYLEFIPVCILLDQELHID